MYNSIQVRLEVIDENGVTIAQTMPGGIPHRGRAPTEGIRLDAAGMRDQVEKELLYKLWINTLATIAIALKVPDNELGDWLNARRHFNPKDCLR